MFNFGKCTSEFNNLLMGFLPEWSHRSCGMCHHCCAGALLTYTVLALFYILYERKLCAWFQCRLDSMRVGKWGLLRCSPICSRFL